MALTQRFGFTYFGGDVDGTLYQDGSKYTSRDRRTLDRILAALETHNHEGGDRLGDPGAAPVLALQVGSGSLRPATTYYYQVSYVDQYGLETAASEQDNVTTPVAIEIPAPPRIDAQPGGTLTPGVYWYALTAHQGDGETPMSSPQVANLSDWLSVDVEAPYGLPEGSDAVSIWRQGPTETYFTRVVTVPIPDPENPPDPLYHDDGSVPADPCACEPDQMPPDTNLTGAASSVLVTVPSVDVAEGTGVQRWRVYRSTTTQFGPESLLAEVVEPVSEGDPSIVNTFLDDGSSSPDAGQPLGVSQTLRPSRSIAIQVVVGALPVSPGQGTIVFFEGSFWVYDGAEWVKLGGAEVLAELPASGEEGDLVFVGGLLYVWAGSWVPTFSLAGGGTGSVLAGDGGAADATDSVSVGRGATATVDAVGSVALGADTVVDLPDLVGVGDRDLEIQSLTRGVIFRSPDGTRWRLTVDDLGSPVFTDLTPGSGA